MFDDLVDFLGDNIHWICIALILVLLWSVLPTGTFILVAIFAIVIGLIIDDSRKEQLIAEGFPSLGRGSTNHNRTLISGRGPDGSWSWGPYCPYGPQPDRPLIPLKEGFPLGKGPTNHNRTLVTGRGLDGVSSNKMCPPLHTYDQKTGKCVPYSYGPGPMRLQKPYCPVGTKPNENCRCYPNGINPDGTCKPLCPSGTIPTKNCVCNVVDMSTGKCVRI